MTKKELAKQLKKRQQEYGIVSRETLRSLSDDEIIDSYITCSCCGERYGTRKEIEAFIEKAKDSEEFLDLTAENFALKNKKDLTIN